MGTDVWKQLNKRNITLFIISMVIIVSRIISVWVNPDIFCDETSILNHMKSIIATGCDYYGNKNPWFGKVGGGLFTYPFMYPMVLFSAIVGVSANSARCILQVVTIISCWLTAKGMEAWTEEKDSFWYTFFISLTLPWGFVQANRIWDPAFVPFYFSIVFYCSCKLFKMNLEEKGRIRVIYEVFLFGGLVLLAVVYPPCRIPAVIMWIYLLIWGIREQKIWKKDIAIIILVCVLFALPFFYYFLFVPSFNSRSMRLLIFQGENYQKEIYYFLKNFFDLLSPTYMFVTGDIVDRHSMPFLGVLGTINLGGAIAWFKKKWDKMEVFLLVTILATFLSVSCTNEYQPHTLRACLAWMPFSILLANGWRSIILKKEKRYRLLIYAVGILWYIVFYMGYVLYYASYAL